MGNTKPTYHLLEDTETKNKEQIKRKWEALTRHIGTDLPNFLPKDKD